jgi:hypothetical protein
LCSSAKQRAQKRLEQLRATESFGQHLELIEAIDQTGSRPPHKELSRALSMDDAPNAPNSAAGCKRPTRTPVRHRCPTGDSYSVNGGRSFSQWLQIGIALTLPLIIFGVIALAVFFWMASR